MCPVPTGPVQRSSQKTPNAPRCRAQSTPTYSPSRKRLSMLKFSGVPSAAVPVPNTWAMPTKPLKSVIVDTSLPLPGKKWWVPRSPLGMGTGSTVLPRSSANTNGAASMPEPRTAPPAVAPMAPRSNCRRETRCAHRRLSIVVADNGSEISMALPPWWVTRLRSLPGEVLHEGQLGVRAVGVETHCPDVVAGDAGDGIEDILAGARVGAGDNAPRTAVPVLGQGQGCSGGSGGSDGPDVSRRKRGRSLEGVVARGTEAVGLDPRGAVPAVGQRVGAVVTHAATVVVPVRAHRPDIVSACCRCGDKGLSAEEEDDAPRCPVPMETVAVADRPAIVAGHRRHPEPRARPPVLALCWRRDDGPGAPVPMLEIRLAGVRRKVRWLSAHRPDVATRDRRHSVEGGAYGWAGRGWRGDDAPGAAVPVLGQRGVTGRGVPVRANAHRPDIIARHGGHSQKRALGPGTRCVRRRHDAPAAPVPVLRQRARTRLTNGPDVGG